MGKISNRCDRSLIPNQFQFVHATDSSPPKSLILGNFENGNLLGLKSSTRGGFRLLSKICGAQKSTWYTFVRAITYPLIAVTNGFSASVKGSICC